MNVTDVMCLITHRLLMSCVYLISCVISGNSTCSRWSSEVSYFVTSLKLKRIEGFKSWKWISFLFKSESVRAGFPVRRRGRRDESEDTARTWQWWECWCDPHRWNGIIPTDSDQNTNTDLSENCSTRFFLLFFTLTISLTCHKHTLHLIVFYIIDWRETTAVMITDWAGDNLTKYTETEGGGESLTLCETHGVTVTHWSWLFSSNCVILRGLILSYHRSVWSEVFTC